MLKDIFKKEKNEEGVVGSEELVVSSEEGVVSSEEGVVSSEEGGVSSEEGVVSREEETQEERLEKAYCLGAGIDGETLAKAKELLKEMGVGSGTAFNPTALQYALRLLNYDSAIAEAKRCGYEAGRAEEIAAAFRDKRSKIKEATSIPHLGGSPNIGRQAENSIFDVARGCR